MDCFRLQQPQRLCSFARVISNWEGDLKHTAARTSRSLGTTFKKTTKTKKQLLFSGVWQSGCLTLSLSYKKCDLLRHPDTISAHDVCADVTVPFVSLLLIKRIRVSCPSLVPGVETGPRPAGS